MIRCLDFASWLPVIAWIFCSRASSKRGSSSNNFGDPRWAWSGASSRLPCVVGFAVRALVCQNVELSLRWIPTVIAKDRNLIYLQCEEVRLWHQYMQSKPNIYTYYHLILIHLRHRCRGNLKFCSNNDKLKTKSYTNCRVSNLFGHRLPPHQAFPIPGTCHKMISSKQDKNTCIIKLLGIRNFLPKRARRILLLSLRKEQKGKQKLTDNAFPSPSHIQDA